MIIKIFGPVGSGKSTISSLLSSRLDLKYVPEVEANDIKFFRLLNKRNRTQTREDKMEFQCYTFEQAYARQFMNHHSVIDTPVDQHFIMASCSLEKDSLEEYNSYYENYLDKVNIKGDRVLNIVLKLPFKTTLDRIVSRGRQEETLGVEEVEFYRSFYDKLFSLEMYPDGSILVDATRDPEAIVLEIISKVGSMPW